MISDSSLVVLKPSILQRCPRRFRERMRRYTVGSHPRSSSERGRSEKEPVHLQRWLMSFVVSFSFSDFGADVTNWNWNCVALHHCMARALVWVGGWVGGGRYWYCSRVLFSSGPSVRIGLRRFYGRSSERESWLLDLRYRYRAVVIAPYAPVLAPYHPSYRPTVRLRFRSSGRQNPRLDFFSYILFSHH